MKVVSVNISEKKGTVKKPVGTIRLTESGVEGDAHAGDWNRQVSLLGVESVQRFEKLAKRKIAWGEFAENITTEGIDLPVTKPLDRITAGETELEITQIGKKCHGDSCAIFREVGNCVMPKEGIFARVIRTGTVKEGDELQYHPKTFRVAVITLSDRASREIYADRSGPRIGELMAEHFDRTGRKYKIERQVIPDDADKLEELLRSFRDNGTDIIITTGGTGIGPRDITPETVRKLIDKELPGVMELIRYKYGSEKPGALLSRGVAGVMGRSLLFTLPGSLKAVNEYIEEIIKILMHAIYMIHGLDLH